jgi:hypothetical protein
MTKGGENGTHFFNLGKEKNVEILNQLQPWQITLVVGVVLLVLFQVVRARGRYQRNKARASGFGRGLIVGIILGIVGTLAVLYYRGIILWSP